MAREEGKQIVGDRPLVAFWIVCLEVIKNLVVCQPFDARFSRYNATFRPCIHGQFVNEIKSLCLSCGLTLI